jgi:hypothetical protein
VALSHGQSTPDVLLAEVSARQHCSAFRKCIDLPWAPVGLRSSTFHAPIRRATASAVASLIHSCSAAPCRYRLSPDAADRVVGPPSQCVLGGWAHWHPSRPPSLASLTNTSVTAPCLTGLALDRDLAAAGCGVHGISAGCLARVLTGVDLDHHRSPDHWFHASNDISSHCHNLQARSVHVGDAESQWLLGQARARNLPLVLMSATGGAGEVMKGIELGAVDYLEKPVSLDKLRNIWQHVVRKVGGA